jgi:hypothetical protein
MCGCGSLELLSPCWLNSLRGGTEQRATSPEYYESYGESVGSTATTILEFVIVKGRKKQLRRLGVC